MQLINKTGIGMIMLSAFIFSCKKSSNNTTTPVTPITLDTVGEYGTPYTGVPDTKDVVMYEVNIHAFSSTHDIPGVTARLDSIKALGVNVVWLMPIYPVGTDIKSINSPYCVKDYENVNTAFGTLTDLRTLVSEAHNKGMAVILDWVADQTSWDNAWITNKAWYHQDGSGNIVSPTSGSTTYTDVAWLNYGNTDMRHAMLTAMKYWIKAANIDGYRCDFASNIPSDFWYNTLDTLNNQMNHKLIMLAENNALGDFGEGFQFDYSWNFYSSLKTVVASNGSAYNIGTTNASEISGIPANDYKLRFITNHDEEISDKAPAVLYNSKAGALAAFALAAYVGGQPLIYTGDEVGNTTTLTMYNNTTTVNWTANSDVTAAYEKLLAFRNTSDAVKTGAITLYTSDANVVAFERTSGSETVLVIVNTHGSSATYTANAAFSNTTWTDQLNGAVSLNIGATIALQPYQYMILSK